MDTTPVRVNTFFTTEHPHNPGGDSWKGTLTDTLQLYKPSVGEQGWGLITDYNFAILDQAMLRDQDQVIEGVNEFRNRVQVRSPQAGDEAVNLEYARREQLIWSLLRR